jgi:hypothetical protein
MVVESKVVLVEHCHAFAGGYFYGSLGGLDIPGQDLQKGRLPGSVGADDAIAIPFSES